MLSFFIVLLFSREIVHQAYMLVECSYSKGRIEEVGQRGKNCNSKDL